MPSIVNFDGDHGHGERKWSEVGVGPRLITATDGLNPMSYSRAASLNSLGPRIGRFFKKANSPVRGVLLNGQQLEGRILKRHVIIRNT
jgi:hypothetical protein